MNTEGETLDARRGTSDDPKLRALLTLAREQISDRGNVTDATWRAAPDAGWTDAQLAEAIVHVALNVLTNFFNHTVQTELDLPPAPAL